MQNLYPAMPLGYQGGRVNQISEFDVVIDLANDRRRFVVDQGCFLSELQIGDLVAFRANGDQILSLQRLTKNSFAQNSLEGQMPVQANFQYLRMWSEFQMVVRTWFHQQDFLEVQTPYLVDCPGTEPYLDLFSTEIILGHSKQKKYLPTSPELHLKKLLSAGLRNIFEIKTCFRNSEFSNRHQPEFLMLEWYRAYDHIHTIKQDLQNLIRYLCDYPWSFAKELPVEHEFLIGLKSAQKSLHQGFVSLSMSELWEQQFGFKLKPDTSLQDLMDLAKSQNIYYQANDQFDDLFNRIFVDRVESKILPDQMIFLEKYPPSQAALARLTEDGWGDRFEFYFAGLEIANAFHELNDPQVQRIRFQEDLSLKATIKKEVPPLDQQFLDSLDYGMPPSGGIALGLERLCMAIFGVKDIRSLRAFPVGLDK